MLLEHVGIGRKIWHNLDPAQSRIEKRKEQINQGHQVDSIKGRADLSSHDAEVRRCNCSHALECASLERQEMVTIASCSLSEDKKRCETLAFDLDCILPVYELLDNTVPRSFITASFDVHGLECVSNGACDWDFGNIVFWRKAGVDWTCYVIHDLKEADVIANNGRRGTSSALWHVWVGWSLG